MRIAHLSDLHFTTFFKKSNLTGIEYLLNYAIEQDSDHIVITGDLTDNADEHDFLLLRQLFSKLGLLNSKKLSLVIGNHDIFGGVQTAEDIFTFPQKCRTVNFKEKVKLFYNYFKETFEDCTFISEDNIFPYAKVINDTLLVGMNSIAEYSTSKNIFASNGSVDLEQLNDTATILDNFHNNINTKIILIHHHFNKIRVKNKSSFGSFWQNIEKQTMKLRKKKRLFNLFKMYQVNLVLHGHFHETGEYIRKGVKFLNGGASVKGTVPGEMKINFVDIKQEAIKIKTVKLAPLLSEYATAGNLLNEVAELQGNFNYKEAASY